MLKRGGNTNIFVLILFYFALPFLQARPEENGGVFDSKPRNWNSRKIVESKGAPRSVIWVVQLSDLHFSVHHPDRALQFRDFVGPALAMINPSLVLITGDLTDGKSKDLLTMIQIEEEWMEYQNVMEEVITRSGLDKSIFFDLRGNHDKFGVPTVGGSFDYFSNYSISGQLGRNANVQSVTVQDGQQKYLFVGFDSTMSVGLRGPSNVFGHPTDQLLTDLDLELSQWDSLTTDPVTKISFGHFPLSFSASSLSGKSLRDIFLKHSLSAYLCGHLHTRFGKNLKRHHHSNSNLLSQKFFQFNVHQISSGSITNCSLEVPPVQEFWEWEMGDWRKSRAMRILAIDSGHVSYVDIDFKTEIKKTILLPTFPLDSRFMSRSSSPYEYKCHFVASSAYENIRALVFSISPIVSVVARIYDSNPGILSLILQAPMSLRVDNISRGDLYTAPWNYKAFEDPSPDRYYLQIEAIDIAGRSTLSDLRPFSINGLTAKVSWTWNEFRVMGVQWAALYYPVLWSALFIMLSMLIPPKAILIFTKKQYTYNNFKLNKSFLNGMAWVIHELSRIPMAWFCIVGYLIYLISFPWFIGKVFTDGKDWGYMTYMGWVVKTSNEMDKHRYIGSPDILVVVLSHLLFVVYPAIFIMVAFAIERGVYADHFLSLLAKKEDDYDYNNKRLESFDLKSSGRFSFWFRWRWIRKVLLIICALVCWKHFLSCRAVMKAYEMNPFLHFPLYCFVTPLLLGYVAYHTSGIN
ncbi:putative metallophosphoesterase At3g03305 [Benincasa hispida]|uniref:putative metallophosphoesterase At3g03305 n=1 Tax=Benincasa hispida TaxID=102211 RepID=UPI0019010065|nr:putative metallophosphoesterase At3g03305 [Benincasa hispida]